MVKHKSKYRGGKGHRNSRMQKHKKITKKQSRKSKNASYEIKLDMTDKSMRDFQASKSITVATTKSDITSSKIGELYDVKPIHDNIHRLCQLKIAGKIIKEYPDEKMPKNVSNQICKCLFEKNRGLKISELEKMVKTRMDTPGSTCISILDKNTRKSQYRKSNST
jgi:hypothetical protein